MNQPGGKGHQQTYSVVLKGITVAGEESSEELKDVSVFQFSDGNTALCEVYFGRHRSQPYYSFGWLEGR